MNCYELFQSLKGGSDLHKKIYAERYETVKTVDEGLQKALDDPGYAFIWATAVLDSMVGHTCNYVAIKEIVFEGIMVFVLRKNSPYKGLFDYL